MKKVFFCYPAPFHPLNTRKYQNMNSVLEEIICVRRAFTLDECKRQRDAEIEIKTQAKPIGNLG